MNGDDRCYGISCATYRRSVEAEVDKRCVGWIAINNGNAIVHVEGIELLPPTAATLTGAAITVSGNAGEYYKGRIQIAFSAGTDPSVQIIQKFYID